MEPKTNEYTLYSQALFTTQLMCIVSDMEEARHILTEILSERAALNPMYSLRAFARDLSISPQQLSNVMSGRRGLSLTVAQRLTEQLELNERQRILFLESLKAKFSKSKCEREISSARLAELNQNTISRNLEMDHFRVISNWYHFAIVQLIKTKNGRNKTMVQFAERLGISENETRLAFARLERLKLIKRAARGWETNSGAMVAEQTRPNEAIRNFHRQILEKAIEALAFQGKDERYGSSSVLPIKVTDLPRAKKLIQKFRIDFDKLVSDASSADEVYALSIQFLRLTQTKNTKIKIDPEKGVES